MLTLNRIPSAVALRHKASAATDITGFGLIGHASQIARESNLTLEMRFSALPTLPGALELSPRFQPAGLKANRAYYEPNVEYASEGDDGRKALLYDPQTSGGLLIFVPESDAGALLAELPRARANLPRFFGAWDETLGFIGHESRGGGRPVRTTQGRKHARALLDVTENKGVSAKVDQDLSVIASTIGENPQLKRVLEHPAIPVEKRKALGRAVFAKANPILLRLLDILIEHELVQLLPSIAQEFHGFWNARRGVTSVEAVSATELSASELKALESALGGVAGEKVELKTSTDPALLGGLLVRMRGFTYDGTVRFRLKALKEALAQGGA